MTSMVTETPVPLEEPSATQILLEPTREATQLPIVLVTPTVETTPDETEDVPTLDITPSENIYELLTFTPTDAGLSSVLDEDITETPAPDDPSLGLGDPTYEDTFANGDNWALGVDSYMDLSAAGGNLVMRGLSTTSGWRITRVSVSNGYIQLTGKINSCSGTDNYGLYFRVPNATTANNGYLFGISCDGKYSLRKWDGETMTSLIYWKSNNAIRKGPNQTNTIGVKLDGYQMELYVNGVLVGSATDDEYGIGSVGIYIAAKETKNLTVLLDDLSVWKK